MEKLFNGNDMPLKLREPLLLFIFALSVRLSIFLYWQQLPLSGDEIYYWTSANVIANGNLTKNFLHPPLWTYMLSIPAQIADNFFYGRIFTAIIGSLSVPVIYMLGRYLFGRKTGIVAGIIYSVYPNLVGFSHYLWPETLLSLLVLISAFLFCQGNKNEKNVSLLYLSFIVLSAGMLAKEFAIIPFGSMLFTITATDVMNKKQIIARAILIFLAPVIIYSAFATVMARRPVILADAFVYNSNEADAGKAIWEKSTKENLEIFTRRLFELKKMPERFINQIYNLWTPTSFPIFRLLNSEQKYSDIPNARLIAYMAAGMYVLVVGLGLTGMCCAEEKPFRIFAVANMLLLSSAGLLFLMCSRFRISFMYIFILYAAVVLSDPRAALGRLTWRRGLLLAVLIALFAEVIIHKQSSFGHWG